MSAFYPICEETESFSYNGITFYDHISSKTESWGDYLQKGNCFFCVVSSKPLCIKLCWKSVGKRKIDQFSYLKLYSYKQDPNDLVETGIFNGDLGSINLKKDFALIDEIAKCNPHFLKLPDFCSDKNAFIAFSQKEIQEIEKQLLLFDLSLFTEEHKKTKKKKVLPRKINKISFLGIKSDNFKCRLKETDISFFDYIHPEADILVYPSDIKHSRGNYEPFVKNEDLAVSTNSLIFHDEAFDYVLKKHEL